MDEKQEKLNEMLTLILRSSQDMPGFVFQYYLDHEKDPKKKIVYNLVADSYLTLFSYCLLMFKHAWSQAFSLLRVGLEQVAAVYLLAFCDGDIEKYIDLNELKAEYAKLESETEQNEFLKNHNIPKGKENSFFDYSWIRPCGSREKYGRVQLLQLAKLDEFNVDFENSLNAFAHGSVSVFQMNGNNWDVMNRYGRRASMTCCKLFDFLCCSYCKMIGEQEFSKLPIDGNFKQFKSIYMSCFEKCFSMGVD